MWAGGRQVLLQLAGICHSVGQVQHSVTHIATAVTDLLLDVDIVIA